MKNLNITVAKKIAQYQQRDGVIVCGNSDYQITFTFDSEWDKYEAKTARFIWNGKYWDQPFTGNVCPVPIITGATEVTVGVYAGDLCTTTPASIPCKRSILCDDVEINDVNIEACREQAVSAAYRAESAAAIAEAANPETQRAELEAYIEEKADAVMADSNALIADELAKKAQIKPEFAESEEWLKTEGNADKTKLYVTPDNFIWACMPKEVGGYKNLLPEAVGDDHTTPYNGKGYKDGARLASGGYESTLGGAFLTGFIPVKVGETLYLNGKYIKTDWANAGSANARFYDENFEDILGASMPMGGYANINQHFIDVVTNEGYVTQFTLNPNWGREKWSKTEYIRMTLIGSGDGCIIANTPIVEGEKKYVWTNTNHSFVPNDYDEEFVALNDSINEAKADIVKLNEATDESIAELNKRIEDVEEGNTSIPEHWKSAIATAKETIAQKQALGGVNCASFVWTSDIHASAGFDERGKRIGIVAKAIMDECDIPLFISTGDLMSQSSHPDTSGVYNELALVRKWLSPIPYYQQALIMGNHDGAWGGTSDETYYKWQLPLSTMYNLIYRKQAMDMRRVSGDNGTYYYIDNESQKVRYIMLNSNNTSSDATNGDGTAVQDRFRKSCLGQTQLYWLSDVALDMPDGYTACIFLHEPYVGSEIDKNDDSYPGEYPQLVGIVDAYNNRGSYSGTFKDSDNTWRESTINKNFANAQGEIAGVFAGHTHVDAIRHTGNNPMYLTCPLIITPNSLGGEVRDGTTRTEGTNTEFAMDIVTIDKAHKHIYLTRLGAGISRDVSYKREG